MEGKQEEVSAGPYQGGGEVDNKTEHHSRTAKEAEGQELRSVPRRLPT